MRLLLLFFTLLLIPVALHAEIRIDSFRVDQGPVLDGNANDAAWSAARPILVNDRTSNETVLLRSVYSGDRIYFLVQYPDKAENLLHKPWTWSEEQSRYVEGSHREDTFVFKWNMMAEDVDLSNYSDDDYRADLWYWKANRSNLAGFADDKMQILSAEDGGSLNGGGEANESKELRSLSGKTRYLRRISDSGQAPYREDEAPRQKSSQVINHFLPQQPSGSRADVAASGRWNGGFWSIEFSRKLLTGHEDDVQLSIDQTALFGISIFSLYANKLDSHSPNFYGMGRISEPLRLHFVK